MFVRNRLFAAFSIAFLTGCAAITPPEGGPRDEKKPLLVSTNPINGSTNFTGKTIRLEFDEDIKTADLNKELIITPNTGNTYTAKTDRRNLILEFSKPLDENTTYNLSFRNGIADITESNKAPEVSLSFSTGNFLDTARVSGKVQDYLTGLPEPELTVGLYPETDTSNIRDHKPYYITRTNANGTFRLENVKAGNYWIYAHQDKNANEYYDQEAEKIGYFTNPVTINPILDSVVLKTVRLDTKKPFVLTTEKALDLNTLVFNEGVKKVSFRTLDKNKTEVKLLTLPNETGKRIKVFAENGKLPENVLVLSTDSSNNLAQDTVRFSLVNKPAIPASLTMKTDKTDLQSEINNAIKFIFPVPVTVTGKTPFQIKEDTLATTLVPQYPKDYQLNENRTELTLNYVPKAKKTVEISLDSTQLVAVNGKPFQKQTLSYVISRKATTGSIAGTVKTNFKDYTIELLDEQQQVIRTDENVRKLQYRDLLPGNYFLRVKIDENNDGKWSLGDKQFKTLPEKLYVYPKQIAVRANWEIEDIDLVF